MATNSTTPRQNGVALDNFNAKLRGSTVWQAFMASNGIDPSRPIKLSDRQRKQLQAHLEANGITFAKGIEIDPAGNANDDQRPGRKIAIGAAITGLALTGAGVAGIGPLAGAFGAGAGSASAGGLATAGAVGSAPGYVPASLIGTGLTGGAGAAGAGAGLFSKLAPLAGAAGAALSAGSQASAQNRGTQIDVDLAAEALDQARQRDYRDAALAREKDRRESADDAYRKVVRAEYAHNPNLPASSSFKPVRSEGQLAAADLMKAEAMKRLQAQDSLLPPVRDDGVFRIDRRLLNPSKSERAAGYGGLALGALDWIL